MSNRTLTEAQVRAIASEVGGPDHVVGVAAAPRWSGDEVLDTDVGKVRVLACPSVLAVREALATYGDAADELLLIITDQPGEELGTEVTERLWRRGLLQPRGWEACKRLFKAQTLDARLAHQRWLVDLLIDVAPARGYPPAQGGVLDADTAWTAFCRHGLDLRTPRPRLAELLDWIHTGAASTAFARFGDDACAHVIERLATEAGVGARPVLQLAAAGRSDEVLRYGLAAAPLWSAEATGQAAERARGRLIDRLPAIGEDTDAALRAWGQAAEAFVTQHLDLDPAVQQVRADAETMLDTLGVSEVVAASNVLPGARTARLEQLGVTLLAALDDTADHASVMPPVRDALQRVGDHLDTARDPDTGERAAHAVRLLQRLHARQPEPAANLADAARRFVDDSSWADQARAEIGRGASGRLGDAYGALLDRLDAQRDAEDRAFADQLARWSRLPPPDRDDELLPIERVLDRIVAPIAAQQPTLVAVLDGLDHPTAHRLLADITDRGWRAHEPTDRPWPAIVAALPTVTEVSRTSLLTGQLARGGQKEERGGFTAHAGLVEAAGKPQLFHKADLGVQAGQLAPTVAEALRDTSQRVVGVVVNAVDDHLARGGQLQLADGLQGIPALRWLLETAAEAGRAVVITSDHGHIRERHTQVVKADGGGERWQPATREPRDDEVSVEGPRVALADGRVLLAATDTVRYTPEKKNGYHGGATPQEALCPIAVIAPARVHLEGLEQTSLVPPWWWELAESPPAEPTTPPAPPAVERKQPERAEDADGVPTLFSTRETEPSAADVGAPSAATGADQPAWIGELLASPVLEAQRRLAGRATLSDDDLARLLTVLDRHRDVVPRGVLQQETGLRPSRLKSKIDALRRTLAVDGYQIVAVDQDGTVRLHRRLLVQQFGVSA